MTINMDRVPVPYLQNVLEEIVQEQEIVDSKFVVELASAAGENYLGVLYRVHVMGRRRIRSYKDVASGGKGEETFSIILKSMPQSEEKRELVGSAKYFGNEVLCYNDIISYFLMFQEEKMVLPTEWFTSVPKCYRAYSDGNNDFLFLEDMKAKGYNMQDRRLGLDTKNCLLVLKELAKYHAFSFALRDQRPEVFDKLKKSIQETIYTDDFNFTKYVDFCLKKALNTMMRKTSESGEYYQKLQEFGECYLETMKSLVKGESAEPYSVICHGDCWINNILFKYSEDGANPVAVCFLDFQISRYSSPVLDITHFVSCCTTGKTRQESYSIMISEYYKSLCGFIHLLGSDPQKLFPESVFKEHLLKFSKFGLGGALMALVIFTSDDTPDIVDFYNTDPEETFKTNAVYEERLSDLVIDMVNYKYI